MAVVRGTRPFETRTVSIRPCVANPEHSPFPLWLLHLIFGIDSRRRCVATWKDV